MLYIAEAVKNIITKLDGNNHFLKSHKKFVESLNLAKMTFSDARGSSTMIFGSFFL